MYVQSDALLLADVFNNFQSMRIEISEIYDLFTDTDLVLIAEKGIKGGICHDIHQETKVNNKYMINT